MANEIITVKEASKKWNISERRILVLCKEGRISGAIKDGKIWKIPAHAEKPKDKRGKMHQEIKNVSNIKLPLPIGISDYRAASTEYYYVDKTMLIKDFLDERPKVSLFMRPRRFGKTLNMDMLRVFFEKAEEDTSHYFKDKKIWVYGEQYRKYQGKYPVIFLTFKDVKFNTWSQTLEDIARIISNEFYRHKRILDNPECDEYEKRFYNKILFKEASSVELMASLQFLSQVLHKYHGIPAIIIIDEYDTPIQQGHHKGFYDDVIAFIRNLFSGGLKDNPHLAYGFLTGILRVAKESIFSGLNNMKINSILDDGYSEYFGFTEDEVKKMAEYYDAQDKMPEIREWYDGYQFGNTEIYNPWSVVNYFSNRCQPIAYWQSTGSNDIIGEILSHATEEILERLNSLVQGNTFLTYIDTGVIYPQVHSNPASIYSFLLVAGYLKVSKINLSISGDYMCEVTLPNKEIAFVYSKEILQKLSSIIPQSTAISIQESLYLGNVNQLQKELGNLLYQSASCYDTVGENFYHGLVLGLCAMLDNYYYISSNRETGAGRYDIQLFPKNNEMPGIIIELKADKSTKNLKQLSKEALYQINEKKYDTELSTKGITNILKYGVAFSGKHVEIAME